MKFMKPLPTTWYPSAVDSSPPTSVQLMPLPPQCGVFLSWNLGESYYGLPYPNISFFLKIQYVGNGSKATSTLKAVGKVWYAKLQLLLSLLHHNAIIIYPDKCDTAKLQQLQQLFSAGEPMRTACKLTKYTRELCTLWNYVWLLVFGSVNYKL